ncbi:MAG: YdcF family protein [Phycisphaerae bacterium]|nr:YdcF family protein [Phycisphaerae bacterium]
MKTSVDKSDDRPRRSFLRRVASIVQWMVNLTVILCLVLVFTPVGDWLGEALISVDPLTKADYIVVLGGKHERAVEAARLYRERWAPKVIVTSRKNSAKALAKVVEAYGVPAKDILIDAETIRTATHPDTVARLREVDIKTDRFIILTSPYHTSRSKACFKRYGYEHICMRSPDWRAGGRYGTGGWSQRAISLFEKVYEVFGWAMYSVFGWV